MLFSWCIPNSPFLLLFSSCPFPVILSYCCSSFYSALLLLPFLFLPSCCSIIIFPPTLYLVNFPSRSSVVFLLSFSCLVILPSCSSLAFFLLLLSYYSPLLLRLDSLYYCCPLVMFSPPALVFPPPRYTLPFILPFFSSIFILPSFFSLLLCRYYPFLLLPCIFSPPAPPFFLLSCSFLVILPSASPCSSLDTPHSYSSLVYSSLLLFPCCSPLMLLPVPL